MKQFPRLATTPPDAGSRIDEILAAADQAGITQQNNNLAMFVSAVFWQTDFLTSLEENLNYSAARLAAVWPSKFDASRAATFAHNPKGIADEVYGHRMGNNGGDDGWNYRGRGYLMTTGRADYEQTGKELQLDLMGNPELLLADPKMTARAAAEQWLRLGLDKAPAGDTQFVARRLTGGALGVSYLQWIYEHLVPDTPQLTQGLTITTNPVQASMRSLPETQ